MSSRVVGEQETSTMFSGAEMRFVRIQGRPLPTYLGRYLLTFMSFLRKRKGMDGEGVPES